MTQTDAARISALCDSEIAKMLTRGSLTPAETKVMLDLNELSFNYEQFASAPDVSEMTAQSADDNVIPEGTIIPVDRRPDETWRDAFDRTGREQRGEEKLGFRIGDRVELNFVTNGSMGRVTGFAAPLDGDPQIFVAWPAHRGRSCEVFAKHLKIAGP